MKPVNSCKSHPGSGRQRGDALLEALLSMVLLGIVGLGLSMAAARAVNTQRFASTQGAVLQQMRHAIGEQGMPSLCLVSSTQVQLRRSAPSTEAAITVPLQVQCSAVTLSVQVAGDSRFTAQLPQVTQRLQLSTSTESSAAAVLTPLLGSAPVRIVQ